MTIRSSILVFALLIPVTLLALPPDPTGVTATTVSDTQIKLTWEKKDDVDGYRIQIKPDGGIWSPQVEEASTITEHTFGGLTEGTKHFLRIWTFKGGDVSANEGTANAFTLLKVPAQFQVIPQFSTAAYVLWKVESAKCTHTQIEYVTGATTNNHSEPKANSHTTLTGLKMGAEYKIRIRATNADTNSVWTPDITVTLPLAYPGNVAANTVSDSQIDVTWNPS